MGNGILVFGANGCGKTTLGRELAKAINFRHMDVEDYYFEKSDVLYQNPRAKEDVIKLMLADMSKYGSFVLSAVTGDYGKEIISMYRLAVFLFAPIELRMDRIRKRAVDQHGDAALPNGELYENTEKFIEFAQAIDLSQIDRWAGTLSCPIIRLDATSPISQNTEKIIKTYQDL